MQKLFFLNIWNKTKRINTKAYWFRHAKFLNTIIHNIGCDSVWCDFDPFCSRPGFFFGGCAIQWHGLLFRTSARKKFWQGPFSKFFFKKGEACAKITFYCGNSCGGDTVSLRWGKLNPPFCKKARKNVVFGIFRDTLFCCWRRDRNWWKSCEMCMIFLWISVELRIFSCEKLMQLPLLCV